MSAWNIMVLSVEECIFLVELFFHESDKLYRFSEVQVLKKNIRNSCSSPQCSSNSHQKMSSNRLYWWKCRRRRSPKLNEQKLLSISDDMTQTPSKSMCRLAQQYEIGLATIHKALSKKLNLPSQSTPCSKT